MTNGFTVAYNLHSVNYRPTCHFHGKKRDCPFFCQILVKPTGIPICLHCIPIVSPLFTIPPRSLRKRGNGKFPKNGGFYCKIIYQWGIPDFSIAMFHQLRLLLSNAEVKLTVFSPMKLEARGGGTKASKAGVGG